MKTFLVCGLVLTGSIFLLEGVIALRKARSVQEYFLAGRTLRIGPFVATLVSTNLSLGNFILLCAIWGYFYGPASILVIASSMVIAAVVYTYVLPRIRPYIEDEQNCGTIHEYLFLGFSHSGRVDLAKRLRFLASTATILTLLLALVLELQLTSVILSRILGADIPVLFIGLASLMAGYATLGGYRSVVFTDILQACLLLIGAILIVVIITLRIGLPSGFTAQPQPGAWEGISSLGWHNMVSLAVMGVGWFLVTMDSWQRACATKSAPITTTGTVISAVSLVAFISVYGILGVYDAKCIQPSLDATALAMHSGGLNPLMDFFIPAGSSPSQVFLFGTVALAFVMAGLSTADTFLIAGAHSFISDLTVGLGRNKSFGDLSSTESIALGSLGRATVALMIALTIAIWVVLNLAGLMKDPLSLFFVAYSVQFALFVPVLITLAKVVPNPGGGLGSICLAIPLSLVCGFGSSYALQMGTPSVLSLRPDQWLALTPVVTVVAGVLGYIVGAASFKEVRNESE